MTHIGDRSLATILAALRNWQTTLELNGGAPQHSSLATLENRNLSALTKSTGSAKS